MLKLKHLFRKKSISTNSTQIKMTNQRLQEKLEKLKKILETLKNTERYYEQTYLNPSRKNYEDAMLQREAVETQINAIENELKNSQ